MCKNFRLVPERPECAIPRISDVILRAWNVEGDENGVGLWKARRRCALVYVPQSRQLPPPRTVINRDVLQRSKNITDGKLGCRGAVRHGLREQATLFVNTNDVDCDLSAGALKRLRTLDGGNSANK